MAKEPPRTSTIRGVCCFAVPDSAPALTKVNNRIHRTTNNDPEQRPTNRFNSTPPIASLVRWHSPTQVSNTPFPITSISSFLLCSDPANTRITEPCCRQRSKCTPSTSYATSVFGATNKKPCNLSQANSALEIRERPTPRKEDLLVTTFPVGFGETTSDSDSYKSSKTGGGQAVATWLCISPNMPTRATTVAFVDRQQNNAGCRQSTTPQASLITSPTVVKSLLCLHMYVTHDGKIVPKVQKDLLDTVNPSA